MKRYRFTIQAGFAVAAIVGLFGVLLVDANTPNWILQLILSTLSLIVGYVGLVACETPTAVFKHIFAIIVIGACISYEILHIRSSKFEKIYTYKQKLHTYKNLYKKAVHIYETASLSRH